VVPAAINASGAVTGALTFPPGIPSHVFLYSGGTLTDLGTLTYPGSATYGAAVGQSINAAGVIAGTVSDPGSPPMWSFGFLYDSTGVLNQLANASGFVFCTATGVNSSSLIVGGCTSTLASQSIAVDYLDGMAQQLGPSGGTATPVAGTAVNDSGQVTASGAAPFIAQSTTTTVTSIPLLASSPAGTQSNPTAINNAGQIVGWQLSGNSYQGFFYGNGTSSALIGVPVSVTQPAIALNNAGQVVGFTQTSSTSPVVPFFLAGGVYSNLNTLISASDPNQPYVTLTSAYAISDAGWIVATGTDSRTPGLTNAYLLTPTTAFPLSVQLSASVTSVQVGSSFTLAWTDQSAASCAASGGSGTDGWKGNLSVSGGQQQVHEVNAGVYMFTLTCKDASSHSVDSTTEVTATSKPTPPSGGGGGALDVLLLALLGALTLARVSPRAPT
jgi:hypothetical protein